VFVCRSFCRAAWGVSLLSPERAKKWITSQCKFTDKINKNALIIELLKDEKIKTALVLTRTKYGDDKFVMVLKKKNIKQHP
jgi:ATP-dependent RNA helicase RhlE